jgi:hypothetical protein
MIAVVLVAAVFLGLAAPAAASPFQSPSRNIGCYITAQGVRCDISRRDWSPPPKPASCELDYGQGLSVGPRGRGRVVCAGDTTLGSGRRLHYGASIARGRFRCTRLRSGMRCVNERRGHGFKLSRQRAVRF